MAQRIEGKLNEVHRELIAKIQINNKAAKDRIKAQRMQAILYKLKNLSFQPTDEVEGLLSDQAQQIIDESLAILNANRKGNRRLSSNDLFHRVHGTSTSYGGDDIFEEELAAALTVIEQQATGRASNIRSRLVGGQSTNIRLSEEINKDIEKIMNQYVKGISTKINNKAGEKNKQWMRPVARSGKVDVNGLSVVSVDAELNPLWDELYRLFSGCTFSVKNYSSYFTNSLNIHLGNTDYYKALYGSLSDLGYDQRAADAIIYSGLKSYQSSQNKSVALHFYHLRFIYELTGAGLYDAEGPVSGVDFLIYNDPSSDAIFVRSTADLIAQELAKKHITSMPTSGIVIAKSKFEEEI